MHVKNGREEQVRFHSSIMNKGEVAVAIALYDCLLGQLDRDTPLPTIGIVTAYKAQ